jgi:hypothetical protein
MLAIALVNRNIKITYRLLGMNFAVYGIAGGAGVLIARGAVHSKLASISGVPTALQPWLTQLSDAAMKPLLIFAVSFAAAGIILLAVSLIYPGRTQPPAGI